MATVVCCSVCGHSDGFNQTIHRFPVDVERMDKLQITRNKPTGKIKPIIRSPPNSQFIQNETNNYTDKKKMEEFKSLLFCGHVSILSLRDQNFYTKEEWRNLTMSWLNTYRCNQWARLVDRFDLLDLAPGECHRYHGLCGVHFAPEDFDGDELKDGALPLRGKHSPPIPGSPSGQRSSPSTAESPPRTDAPRLGSDPASSSSQSGCARCTPGHRYMICKRVMDATEEAAEELKADATEFKTTNRVRFGRRLAEKVMYQSAIRTTLDEDVAAAAAAARAVAAVAETKGPSRRSDYASAAAFCLELVAYERFRPAPPPFRDAAPDPGPTRSRDPLAPVTRDPAPTEDPEELVCVDSDEECA